VNVNSYFKIAELNKYDEGMELVNMDLIIFHGAVSTFDLAFL